MNVKMDERHGAFMLGVKDDKITQNAPMNQTNFSTKEKLPELCFREFHFIHEWNLFLVVNVCISDFTVLDGSFFIILFHVDIINYNADIS